jgi:DNA-binding NtrC family response regulator
MSPKKILIVEDDPIVRDLCAVVLTSNGFDSILATNGMEGVEVYRKRHKDICLVISDISMPVMNGIEMVQKIVQMHPRTKVVLMSAYSIVGILPDELRKLCTLIEKPFTAERLLNVVNNCLRYDEDQRLSSVAVSEAQFSGDE